MAFLSQSKCGGSETGISCRSDRCETGQNKKAQSKNDQKQYKKFLSQKAVKASHCRLSAIDSRFIERERPSNVFSSSQAASVTIEASLAITFFLIFFLSVISLFLVIDWQMNIQRALEQLGDEMVKTISLAVGGETEWDALLSQTAAGATEGDAAGYSSGNTEGDAVGNADGKTSGTTEGTTEGTTGGMSGMEGIWYLIRQGMGEEILRQRFLALLRDNQETGGGNHSGAGLLTGETDRISFAESKIDPETGQILLAVTYPIRLPVGIVDVGEFTITQYSYRYGWIGDGIRSSQEKESDGQIVYITENSQVYHLSDDCTYLRLSIRMVEMEEVWELRSADGRVYTACELCRPEAAAKTVYVTDHGERYHGDINCSGLKRTFQAISITEVGERRLCSRCAKASQEGG